MTTRCDPSRDRYLLSVAPHRKVNQMVELPSGPLAEIDSEFQKMALETGNFTYELAGTSLREKLFQNLTNDVCRLQLGLAFRLHVTAAQMNGIGYADLLALIRFVAPYAGYRAAADGLGRLSQVATDVGMDTSDRGEAPAATERPPLPEDLDLTDGWMSDFLQSRAARAWSEPRLSQREKAVIALTTDVSQQCLEDLFRLHVKLALEAGVSQDELRDVIRFCGEMSLAKAVRAQRELETVLKEL
jgi:4-carboxymuconolactone decarboxylase